MSEKKMAFEYLGPDECKYCKHSFEYGGPKHCGRCKHSKPFSGVCDKSSVRTAFLTNGHECDVELPEKDQCEPYDTNKNKVVSIKIEDLELNGWHPIYEFPNNDRIVNVMYDDGSTSDNALGFCDEISSIPPTGKRIWWELRNGRFSIYSHFIAWRDL